MITPKLQLIGGWNQSSSCRFYTLFLSLVLQYEFGNKHLDPHAMMPNFLRSSYFGSTVVNTLSRGNQGLYSIHYANLLKSQAVRLIFFNSHIALKLLCSTAVEKAVEYQSDRRTLISYLGASRLCSTL